MAYNRLEQVIKLNEIVVKSKEKLTNDMMAIILINAFEADTGNTFLRPLPAFILA